MCPIFCANGIVRVGEWYIIRIGEWDMIRVGKVCRNCPHPLKNKGSRLWGGGGLAVKIYPYADKKDIKTMDCCGAYSKNIAEILYFG